KASRVQAALATAGSTKVARARFPEPIHRRVSPLYEPRLYRTELEVNAPSRFSRCASRLTEIEPLRDGHHAVWAHRHAPRAVLLRVHPHLLALGYHHVLVDDGVAHHRAPTYLDVVEQHGVLHLRIRVHAHAPEGKGAPEGSAGDDDPARQQRV